MGKNSEEDQRNKISAQTDYLTGFLNRQGLYECFERLPDYANVSFMFLDIDNFKGVNDTYGHAMGDELLVAVSRMIKSKIGSSRLARIGGDEFVIMSEGMMTEKNMSNMAQQIIDSVNDIDISMEIKLIISFSIGIVMDQKKSMGLNKIMPKCDAAMYETKRRGKNGYVVYSTIENLFEIQQTVDREKAPALQKGEFEVRYVPVMNLLSSVMVCYRSYLVWNRRGTEWREELFKEFIKDSSFIVQLEQYAFQELCRMISQIKYEKIRKVPVIFTISSINVNRISFVDELLKTVDSYGIPPAGFIIQLDHINERIDATKVQRFFEKLKKAGFRTAVKGFGSNGSSIMLIKELNLDYVSIGKDIVDNLMRDRKDSLFVKNILSLVNDLNLEPIAEGIDNAQEVRSLTSYGCSTGTGLIFSDALKKKDFLKFAAHNIPNLQKSVKFLFQGSLKDENGEYEGEFIGDGGAEYVYDEQLKKEVLNLAGGQLFVNVVEFPVSLIGSQSYTICIKFKMKSMSNWSSLIYGMYADGFMSFMPYAWNGVPIYRIKDDDNDNGWNDAIGERIDMNWHTAVVTYSHKTQVSNLYMDGKCVGSKEDVPVLASPRRLVLGGDVYAPSCEAFLSEMMFFDHVLNQKEVEKYA